MKHLFLAFLLTATCTILPAAQQYYTVSDGWVTSHNLARYNNRPIYLHNTNAFILTGDKPIVRLARESNLYGTVYLSLVRGNMEKPLQDFSDITSCYRGGQMKWILRDRAFPSCTVTLVLVPSATDFGAECYISVKGTSADRIKWFYGEKQTRHGSRLSWSLDVMGHPELLNWGIGKDFSPLQQGTLSAPGTHYLSMTVNAQNGLTITENRRQAFDNSVRQRALFNSRLSISTPDPYLNAIAEASVTAVDGCWYPPVFVHGCMQWNNALPGWRTMFGGIAYGWHDRIAQEAKHYIASQVTQSNKTVAVPDSNHLGTVQAANSRFYGVGRLLKDQDFYDMQTQFFDQLVEEYRWNGTSQFTDMLRPALELHLKWMDECFDPDQDGLYESYINTWPTDAQWYNGGGTAEETSYAYRAHRAALDMALTAHDSLSARHHTLLLDRIRKGFFSRLWLKDNGFSGAYREQGGYERIHRNPWLYSIFLPIDAQLTTPLQSIESLYYPEWALQNDTIQGRNRVVWTSNWVPGTWSVRELWPGDNYHLALSYFQSGLPDEGWEILKGTFMSTGFCHTVPANLGSHQGGIDFGDCVHPFARTVVSGLFGYNPDYPHSKVLFAPSFPTDWKQASIALPDFSLKFQDAKGILNYHITLAREAAIELNLPVRCGIVKSVTANGRPITFRVNPMAGGSMIVAEIGSCRSAAVQVRYANPLPVRRPLRLTLPVHSNQTITLPDCTILSLYDPQQICVNPKINAHTLSFRTSDNTGYHTAIARVRVNKCEQWRVLHLNIIDPEKERQDAALNMQNVDLKRFSWTPVDIAKNFNADVRTIFQQNYRSPRPNTVSVRIGTNGYSPWAFTYWNSPIPHIMLDSVPQLLTAQHQLATPAGPRFLWNATPDRNIAFTSLWDNYPHQTCFDMQHQKAQCISFLVCGSTNVMQCDIANAVLAIHYDDGTVDSLELIPPYNYWNLSPIDSHASGPGQPSRNYYTVDIDRFCLHGAHPNTVALGQNCRAMVLSRRLHPDRTLNRITLSCRSQEVVVGLMGIALGN
jgi:hypothetical protein